MVPGCATAQLLEEHPGPALTTGSGGGGLGRVRLHHEAAQPPPPPWRWDGAWPPRPPRARVGAQVRTAAGWRRGGWRSSRPVTLSFVPWLALGTPGAKVAREGDTGASPGPACQGRPRRRPAGAVGHRGGWAIAVAPDKKPQVSRDGQTCTARAEVQAHARGRARRAMTPSARAADFRAPAAPPPQPRPRPAGASGRRVARVASDCARGWAPPRERACKGLFGNPGFRVDLRAGGAGMPLPGHTAVRGASPNPSCRLDRPEGLLESGRSPTGGGSESGPEAGFSRGLGGGPPQASGWGWMALLEATWEAASLAAGPLRPGQWGSRWMWPARATTGWDRGLAQSTHGEAVLG